MQQLAAQQLGWRQTLLEIQTGLYFQEAAQVISLGYIFGFASHLLEATICRNSH